MAWTPSGYACGTHASAVDALMRCVEEEAARHLDMRRVGHDVAEGRPELDQEERMDDTERAERQRHCLLPGSAQPLPRATRRMHRSRTARRKPTLYSPRSCRARKNSMQASGSCSSMSLILSLDKAISLRIISKLR